MKKWEESEHPREKDGRFADKNEAVSRYKNISIAELKKQQAIEIEADTISLPDEEVPRSVGAKWRNYDVLMPDGRTAHLAEGSKLQNKEVFAGKGCKRKIDDIERLVRSYGGKAENWQKVKAIGTIVCDGEEEKVELHWYEESSVGKVEFKAKWK